MSGYRGAFGGVAAAIGLMWAPAALAASPVTALTQQELQAHHIEVTNWSRLVAYVAYHALANGRAGAIGTNVRRFWHQVGDGNPGLQSLAQKEQELSLLMATARMAATRMSVVNRQGQPVRWRRYMEKPHRYYYFAIAEPDGHVLSTVVVPWADPKPVRVRTIPTDSGRRPHGSRATPGRAGYRSPPGAAWRLRVTRD